MQENYKPKDEATSVCDELHEVFVTNASSARGCCNRTYTNDRGRELEVKNVFERLIVVDIRSISYALASITFFLSSSKGSL